MSYTETTHDIQTPIIPLTILFLMFYIPIQIYESRTTHRMAQDYGVNQFFYHTEFDSEGNAIK